jgi:hypothetical protein
MEKRGYLELPFSWIFALIVGAFILFIAILLIVKITKTETSSQDIQTSKAIGVLLNSLELSYEEGTSNSIQLPQYSKVYSTCSNSGNYFGTQGILVNEKLYNKWQKSSSQVSFQDKYLFIENFSEGKNFYIFSKSFYFPFKVATLTYMTPTNKDYCFVNPPYEIRMEISKINQENLRVLGSNCTENSLRICFSQNAQDCHAIVDYNEGYLIKNHAKFWFSGNALMYAALFSDKDLYECQVKRLIKRASSLTDLYREKLLLSSYSDCSTDILSNLDIFASYLDFFNNSKDFQNSFSMLNELNSKNQYSICRLW